MYIPYGRCIDEPLSALFKYTLIVTHFPTAEVCRIMNGGQFLENTTLTVGISKYFEIGKLWRRY